MFVALCWILSVILQITIAVPILGGEKVGSVHKNSKGIVIKGQDRYPYVVSVKVIEYDDSDPKQRMAYTSNCGGVLLRKNAVLTAAHCILERVTEPEIVVQAGVVQLDLEKSKGQTIHASKYVIHEQFIDRCEVLPGRCIFSMNDIAILWMESEFILNSKIEMAELNISKRKPINKKGWILGWGQDETGELSPMLKRGEMRVISKTDCRKSQKSVYIVDEMICLKSDDHSTTSCKGDSGGPLVIREVVYGICIFNKMMKLNKNEVCDSREAAVYLDVAYYSDWIQGILDKGSKNKDCKTCSVKPPTDLDLTGGRAQGGTSSQGHHHSKGRERTPGTEKKGDSKKPKSKVFGFF